MKSYQGSIARSSEQVVELAKLLQVNTHEARALIETWVDVMIKGAQRGRSSEDLQADAATIEQWFITITESSPIFAADLAHVIEKFGIKKEKT